MLSWTWLVQLIECTLETGCSLFHNKSIHPSIHINIVLYTHFIHGWWTGVRFKGSLKLIGQDLIESSYVDSIAEEINELLMEAGTLEPQNILNGEKKMIKKWIKKEIQVCRYLRRIKY